MENILLEITHINSSLECKYYGCSVALTASPHAIHSMMKLNAPVIFQLPAGTEWFMTKRCMVFPIRVENC